MSKPQPARPAKLVIGLFLRDKALAEDAAQLLMQAWGPIDMVSRWLSFDFTDYYTAEMGAPLYRRMLVFRRLVAQEHLAAIKLRTNEIEQRMAAEGKRRVNLDPGYLLYERFVLATGKNYSHRIYIGQGIYADLTLMYQQGAYRALPWTYPDYAHPAMGTFLLQVRGKYAVDLKHME